MTRRLLSTIGLTTFVTASLFGFAAPASADDTICIGGENQRKPGQYQGICIGDPIDVGNILKDLCKIGQ